MEYPLTHQRLVSANEWGRCPHLWKGAMFRVKTFHTIGWVFPVAFRMFLRGILAFPWWIRVLSIFILWSGDETPIQHQIQGRGDLVRWFMLVPPRITPTPMKFPWNVHEIPMTSHKISITSPNLHWITNHHLYFIFHHLNPNPNHQILSLELRKGNKISLAKACRSARWEKTMKLT